jgi:hypothetical protein
MRSQKQEVILYVSSSLNMYEKRVHFITRNFFLFFYNLHNALAH